MSTAIAVTPDRIMQLGLGFWGSKALLSAIEIGLFTELANGPLNSADLSRRLRLHSRSARDFYDALVSLGMLERDGERYRNSPTAAAFSAVPPAPTCGRCCVFSTTSAIRYG